MTKRTSEKAREAVGSTRMVMPPKWQWLTTAPHPNPAKRRTCEVDAGQRGWKTHAVMASDSETLEDIGHRRSMCGLKPAHGWGVDLFIEARCERCEAMMAKRYENTAETRKQNNDL